MDPTAFDTTRLATLLEGLGRSVGLPELQPDENGSCTLMFDEVVVTFQQDAPGRQVTLHTQIGILPADAPAARLETLLAANLFWIQTAGATLALLPANRALVLAQRFELERVEQVHFEEALARFLDTADLWRDALLKPEAPSATENVRAMTFGMLA